MKDYSDFRMVSGYSYAEDSSSVEESNMCLKEKDHGFEEEPERQKAKNN